ncbi:MAG: hypothetical protein LBQ88_22320 [Treponema sp.]|jgi:hypothetical protein|nr:hypothetical protein [Treponema sp.]
MTKGLTGNKDCRYFDGCSAPLCPEDKGAAGRAWFPGEDICRLVDVPDWVKRQRKVSRKAAQGGYFTLAMLDQDCRISRGMKGIDPDGTDQERSTDESVWFTAHPAITAEGRERNRAIMAKNRAFLPGSGAPETKPQQGLGVFSGKKGIRYLWGFYRCQNANSSLFRLHTMTWTVP